MINYFQLTHQQMFIKIETFANFSLSLYILKGVFFLKGLNVFLFVLRMPVSLVFFFLSFFLCLFSIGYFTAIFRNKKNKPACWIYGL